MSKNITKTIDRSVNDFVTALKENPSVRFSKTDFQGLIFAILSDRNFKAKRYLVRADEIIEEDNDISGAMLKFLDRLLKHAGMSKSEERQMVLDTFEYGARDIEWIADAADEAMWIYSESGKNMRVFRDKMVQLTIKRMVRSGKASGAITYKKTVVDRQRMLMKKKAKEES